jgi:general secretion pathway protein A
MTTKLLALYGLKWNPFVPDVPTEALRLTPRVEHFCWRVEALAREGGFALVAGEPGVGKSVALRLLVERLAALRDVKVALLSRPQSGVADFYRELGDLFGVPLAPHNRWAGAKALREKWQAHIDAALFRPVLIVDEAQEMQVRVLNELRLLGSTRLDSQILLSAVLAGDGRLLQQLRADDLLPLGSRVRVKLLLERATPAELEDLLRHALAKAGAPTLMTPELITTLCEHAAGNARALMTMAGELLAEGAQRDARQLDEQLYLEVFAVPPSAAARAAAGGRRR